MGEIINRDHFIQQLNQQLGNPKFTPYHPSTDLPQRQWADKSQTELLALAIEKAKQVNASIVTTSQAGLNDLLEDLIQQAGDGPVILPTDPRCKLGSQVLNTARSISPTVKTPM